MQDLARFRASERVDEVAVLLYRATRLAMRLGYTAEQDVSECDAKRMETEKILGATIRSMRND